MHYSSTKKAVLRSHSPGFLKASMGQPNCDPFEYFVYFCGASRMTMAFPRNVATMAASK